MAEQVCRRITRKTIAALQESKRSLLSGDDSGLATTWDEICVQVQLEESGAWDAYEDTVRQILADQVAKLSGYEREALWLQTSPGEDWQCEDESDREAYPVCDDDIVEYVLNEGVFAEAANWTNRRIRRFLDADG